MKKLIVFLFCFLPISVFAEKPPEAMYYRDQLVNKIRGSGVFKVFRPDGTSYDFHYNLKINNVLHSDFKEPRVLDMTYGSGKGTFARNFLDKVMLSEDSYLEVGGEKISLTCIYVDGRDNRFTGNNSPLVPKLFMRVYLVANSFNCDGPLRKGWPETGGKKETWNTYLYYEIRDPTIMLPTEVMLRYIWNEYFAMLQN